MTDPPDKRSPRVIDRRVSSLAGGTGEPAGGDAPTADGPQGADATPQAGPAPEAAGPRGGDAGEKKPQVLPEMDFVTFVLSLSTSAMVALGALPDPETGKPVTNLSLAKQTIDILGVLQEKTHGNLTGEEERILDSVLYDLRMSYVRVAGGRS